MGTLGCYGVLWSPGLLLVGCFFERLEAGVFCVPAEKRFAAAALLVVVSAKGAPLEPPGLRYLSAAEPVSLLLLIAAFAPEFCSVPLVRLLIAAL